MILNKYETFLWLMTAIMGMIISNLTSLSVNVPVVGIVIGVLMYAVAKLLLKLKSTADFFQKQMKLAEMYEDEVKNAHQEIRSLLEKQQEAFLRNSQKDLGVVEVLRRNVVRIAEAAKERKVLQDPLGTAMNRDLELFCDYFVWNASPKGADYQQFLQLLPVLTPKRQDIQPS